MRLRITLAILVLTLFSTLGFGQASNKSLNGTYTFVIGSISAYSYETNWNGQEVGFCNSGQLPYGYNCNSRLRQDVITGTLLADGNGNILTGSTYVFTSDPNSYQCGPDLNPTPDCPYKVPSGIGWSSSTKYVVGDEVDFTDSLGQAITVQAVVNGPSKPVVKNGSGAFNVCTSSANNTTCQWVQLYQSATGVNDSGTGTVTGTYIVNSNASGVMTMTPSSGKSRDDNENPESGGSNTYTLEFAFVLPATSGLGQVVSLVAMPTLGNENRGSGTAVRIK
jgi:hypothetical protein